MMLAMLQSVKNHTLWRRNGLYEHLYGPSYKGARKGLYKTYTTKAFVAHKGLYAFHKGLCGSRKGLCGLIKVLLALYTYLNQST